MTLFDFILDLSKVDVLLGHPPHDMYFIVLTYVLLNVTDYTCNRLENKLKEKIIIIITIIIIYIK